MRKFEQIIRKNQRLQNLILLLRYLLLFFVISGVSFSLLYFSYIFVNGYQLELFLFATSLKIILAAVLIYFVLKLSRTLLNRFNSARYLDKHNQDTSDTFQNAYELYLQQEDHVPTILQKIFTRADEKAEEQIVRADISPLQKLYLPVFLILLTLIIQLIAAPNHFSATWDFFKLSQLPAVQHKEFVEVVPGDLQVVRNSRIEIEVINPEPEVAHRIFYKVDTSWREESLADHKKVFPNLDYSLSYFIKTPYAVSDTFLIEVFELPAVKQIDVKYDYPAFTGIDPLFEQNTSGVIRAVEGTEIGLSIQANNPIEEGYIVFSNGQLQELERTGKASFKTGFILKENLTYHFNLTDILGNRSEKISRNITIIPDLEPEIRIISPGKDTLLTQNLLLPLKIYAADDFGLQELQLKYDINSAEVNALDLLNKISEKVLNYEYILDLTTTFLIPGDRVTYWVEISDNFPLKHTVSSRRYVAKFPSIEEIYQEIEREEQAKSELLQNTLDRSQDLQEEFQEKQREMLKKDEFDWEDQKELEKILEQQEDLNKNIEQVAEDYQELLEKFENNQALSNETLEKMEQIKELMEEIASDDLLEAMENMRENLENVDPEVMKEAMKNFQFSMEDFSQKLEQTIDLLEAIKKEQAVQKSLEIAEEMEEMQSELNNRTSESDADMEKLSQDQRSIEEKLQSLMEQLEEAASMMDPQKDSELKKALEELKEQIEQDSLAADLQEIGEQLNSQNPDSAQENQQQALEKMQDIRQQLSSMQQMMAAGAMLEMGEIIEKTIKRLLIFSHQHEKSKAEFVDDPFLILHDQLAVFEGISISLKELYSVPMIVLALGPKFIYDANYTNTRYSEMFVYINEAKKYGVKTFLEDIQKGINLMIYDLMQAQNNMQQGGGGGSMQSLMQAMQQMGQQQMMMNMMTMEIMQQMGENGRMSNDLMQQSRRLAAEEQRLADNLKRMLQNNPEAQKQTSALNNIIEDLESISRNLQRGRVTQDIVDMQERILSRLLDAQRSIHKREFSKKRKAETSEIETWELPEEIKLKFDKLRQKALLNEDYQDFPREYQELIEEYLKLLNEKANEQDQ